MKINRVEHFQQIGNRNISTEDYAYVQSNEAMKLVNLLDPGTILL